MKNIYRNILVLFASLFIFLLIAEAGTRIIKPDSGNKHDKYMAAQDRFFFNVPINRKDPHLFWRLKPRAQFDKISTNSKGFRGKDFSEEKDVDTIRIITLGDSCTLGVGVANNETYAAILTDILHKETGSPHYEVINAGVAGYTSLQGMRYLKSELIRYRPDIITVQFGFNDYLYTAGPDDKDTLMPGQLAISVESVLSRSHFFRFLKRRVSSLLLKETKFPPNRRVEIKDFRDNLKEIVSIANKAGVRVLLLNLPVRPDIPLVVNAVPFPKDTENGRVTEWFRPAIINNKNYYVQSDFDGPVSVLEKTIEKYPQWSLAHYFLARKYENSGEIEKAQEEFRKARETDTDRKVIQEYNRIIHAVGEETNTPVADLVTAFALSAERDLFLDERHPSAHANSIIAREVYNKLKTVRFIE